jgi:hypothetical protein
VTAPARHADADGLDLLSDGFLPDASPVPGCAGCAELADKRTHALSVYDWSAVSDTNVLIRRHPTH